MSHSRTDYFKGVNPQRRPIDAAVAPFANFIKRESAGGIVLMVSTLAALALANSTPGIAHAFHEVWTGTPLICTSARGSSPRESTLGTWNGG